MFAILSVHNFYTIEMILDLTRDRYFTRRENISS